jgi:hypothetical protein
MDESECVTIFFVVVAFLVVGIALQVTGVVVTLYGLDDVKRGLFPGSRIPVISWVRDAVNVSWTRIKAAGLWVLRKLHLRKRGHVIGLGATVTATASMSARLRVGSVPLKLPRRDEERWPWVLATMENLRVRVDHTRNDLADQIGDMREEHDAQVEALRAEMSAAAEDATAAFAVMLYGNAGHGLNVAALGIALAVAGSVLATVAALAL